MSNFYKKYCVTPSWVKQQINNGYSFTVLSNSGEVCTGKVHNTVSDAIANSLSDQTVIGLDTLLSEANALQVQPVGDIRFEVNASNNIIRMMPQGYMLMHSGKGYWLLDCDAAIPLNVQLIAQTLISEHDFKWGTADNMARALNASIDLMSNSNLSSVATMLLTTVTVN